MDALISLPVTVLRGSAPTQGVKLIKNTVEMIAALIFVTGNSLSLETP